MTDETSSARPTRIANPIPAPGCYSLHLYCDHENPEHDYSEFPHAIDEFQTYSAAMKFARKRGWKLHGDGTATCPKCVRALKGSHHD